MSLSNHSLLELREQNKSGGRSMGARVGGWRTTRKQVPIRQHGQSSCELTETVAECTGHAMYCTCPLQACCDFHFSAFIGFWSVGMVGFLILEQSLGLFTVCLVQLQCDRFCFILLNLIVSFRNLFSNQERKGSTS